MKKKYLLLLILALALFQTGMGRRPAQYDEEAREAERQEKLQKKAEGVHDHSIKRDIQQPEAGTDDTTKVRIKIPGT